VFDETLTKYAIILGTLKDFMEKKEYVLSLKENIEMVKEELNSEEKFFEKAVMTEKFVKKYKKAIIGSIIAIVLVVTADIAYTINEQNRIESANETLALLEKNPNDTVALSRLENLSPQLHDVWLYSQAIVNQNAQQLQELKATKALVIDDTSVYESAQLKADKAELDTYASNEKAIYKDLAYVMEAVLLLEDKKIDEAHAKLSMVALNSPLADVASALMHYGVK
jgi:hypothetical protein